MEIKIPWREQLNLYPNTALSNLIYYHTTLTNNPVVE